MDTNSCQFWRANNDVRWCLHALREMKNKHDLKDLSKNERESLECLYMDCEHLINECKRLELKKRSE